MGDRPEVGRLVRASADGDEAASNKLVRRFAHPVMAMIRSYCLTPADAEDVYQTVWLKPGGIGPTPGRSLARLRQTRALRRYLGTQPAAEHQKGGDQLELAPLDRR